MASVFPEESNRIKYIHRSFKRMGLQSKSFNSVRSIKRSNWKTISFPEKIDLIESPNETLKYFNLAYKYFRENSNLEFNLSNVNYFSPESLAVFAACVADKNYTNNMRTKGNLPKSLILRKLFSESGFFEHVYLKNGLHKSSTKESSRFLHNISDEDVDTDIAKESCLFVKEKIGAKYIDDMEPLYVILIEAMQNTNNHASIVEKESYDWWLYRYEDKRNQKLHFTFLDIGVGVFNSLPVKDWKRRLTEKIGFNNNLDLVDDLLNGKIMSRTLRKDRGKGIPQIYDSSKDVIFEEFYILSNDVLIDTKKTKYTLLDEEFHGTLYYWTTKIENNEG